MSALSVNFMNVSSISLTDVSVCGHVRYRLSCDGHVRYRLSCDGHVRYRLSCMNASISLTDVSVWYVVVM